MLFYMADGAPFSDGSGAMKQNLEFITKYHTFANDTSNGRMTCPTSNCHHFVGCGHFWNS